MIKERAVTVWSYMAKDQDINNGKPYKRTICFRVGSIVYNGNWMGPSDCFWIVPGTIEDEGNDMGESSGYISGNDFYNYGNKDW